MSTPPATTPPNDTPSKTVYELLEDLTEKEYSSIKTDVVTKGFAELHATYVVTKANVTYSIELLNLLPSDGDITDCPSDYKTTVAGVAVVENGKIVELDGSPDVTLPSYDELRGKFHFDEGNFANVVAKQNSFAADVISPSDFCGGNAEMSNLKVSVAYSEASLLEVILSYQTATVEVEIVYTFSE
jgi:hypothetical protein